MVLYRELENGLTLLGEPMPWLRSVAFSLNLPGGTCYEPDGLDGLAIITSEMTQRGCGQWDSRAFMEELDFHGIQRSSAITTNHASINCAMAREVLPRCLELFANLVQRPHLPESQIEDGRNLCIQDLRALDDEPSHRCFSELKRFRFSLPYGRIAQGTLEGLEAIDQRDVQTFFKRHYSPRGSILAIAGNFEWPRVCELVEKEFGQWHGEPPSTLPSLNPISGCRHVDHSSSQTHLALAYECAAYDDPQYYEARALVGVLSDGMSSRLFTELREKRGLVYSVFANCFSLAGIGSVLCYAGTTTNRADETLQVLLESVESLGHGIEQEEVDRLKNRIRSSMVFEQESSVARSSQIASDWYYLGRVPSHQEIAERINGLTAAGLVEYFREHQPRNFSLVTVGSQPLTLPSKGDAVWSY